jgi:Transcriptional regulator
MIEKAFEIVRREGDTSLTARKLAKELNCSTQPIYQAFSDMKELKMELIKKAQENMFRYIMQNDDTQLPKELAYILSYIQFAREEKNLFQLIFTTGGLNLSGVNELDTDATNMNMDLNMIIYANGIVMMQAFHSFEDSDEKIKDMLIHAYEVFKQCQ